MIEIDQHTHEGHENFKTVTWFTCGDGKRRTFRAWLEWMKTWDPLAVEDKREPGPGIAKRPRPAKTTGGN